MDNQVQEIKNLQEKNQELTKKLEELSSKFDTFSSTLENHTHGGLDGSKSFYNETIALKPGTGISSGKYGFIDAEIFQPRTSIIDRLMGALVVGDGTKGSGIVDNIKNTSQLSIEHQPLTNGTTNNTFFYGFRSPVYSGTNNGSVTSGGTTLSQNKFTWEVNELAGAYLLVVDSANPTTADTKDTAEGTTGAFTTSITGLTPNTLYHVRAFATNSVGTSYGSDVTFTTLAATSGNFFQFF